jgi:hypothetical protein
MGIKIQFGPNFGKKSGMFGEKSVENGEKIGMASVI